MTQNSAGEVISIPGKRFWNAVPILRPSEKELLEQHSSVFSHKNTPGYVNALHYLNFHSLCTRRCHLDAIFLLILTVLNFVVPLLKLLAFAFLFEILDISFVYSFPH
jgi:hypothetical protein